jgi:hypothetical protein
MMSADGRAAPLPVGVAVDHHMSFLEGRAAIGYFRVRLAAQHSTASRASTIRQVVRSRHAQVGGCNVW